MEVKGKIKLVGETQTFGKSDFKKRELVVATDEQYPQDILIEFVQDKCPILDKYKVGQSVSIGINLRGREWVNPQGETRYFNSIQGWKIQAVQDSDHDAIHDGPFKTVANKDLNSDKDDLPF